MIPRVVEATARSPSAVTPASNACYLLSFVPGELILCHKRVLTERSHQYSTQVTPEHSIYKETPNCSSRNTEESIAFSKSTSLTQQVDRKLLPIPDPLAH